MPKIKTFCLLLKSMERSETIILGILGTLDILDIFFIFRHFPINIEKPNAPHPTSLEPVSGRSN